MSSMQLELKSSSHPTKHPLHLTLSTTPLLQIEISVLEDQIQLSQKMDGHQQFWNEI